MQPHAIVVQQLFRILHKSNSGLSATRNYGVRHANSQSQFVVFLDHDDLLEPHALAVMWLKLRAHPEASYTYTDQWFFGLENHVWQTQHVCCALTRWLTPVLIAHVNL
jgi:glycosyltransferase involved in cell wall biosynthesis